MKHTSFLLFGDYSTNTRKILFKKKSLLAFQKNVDNRKGKALFSKKHILSANIAKILPRILYSQVYFYQKDICYDTTNISSMTLFSEGSSVRSSNNVYQLITLGTTERMCEMRHMFHILTDKHKILKDKCWNKLSLPWGCSWISPSMKMSTKS